MAQQGAAGLFLDPGLGKTSISLALVDTFKRQRLHRAALVICPLRPAYLVWPVEAQKWIDFHGLKVCVLHGKEKDKLLRAGKHDIYVLNPEGLRWLLLALQKYYKNDWPFDVLIVDESSKFRNGNTQRFKMLRMVLGRFKRRYILTGTPTPMGLLNLWTQIFILDMGAALGRYFTHYRDAFFIGTGYGGYTYVPKAKADKSIYERLRALVLRMAAEDYLELPPISYHNIYVDLPPSAAQQYRQMERTLFIQMDDGTITAANAAVAGGKCRQIANGGVFTDVDPANPDLARKWAHLHDAKSEALVDLLDELEGQPALVAYEFQHDLARTKAALKKAGYGDVPHVGGGVSAKRAVELERAWNLGELPVLLGQPQSVAWGLNLQEHGRAVVFHSLIWDLEAYLQFIRRVWRQGQLGRVFVYHIVARNTVDEAVLGAWARKQRTQQALFDALTRYRTGQQKATA